MDCSKTSGTPELRDTGCGNDTKPKNGSGKCGDPPVCLTGWSGEGCSKPDPPSGNFKIPNPGIFFLFLMVSRKRDRFPVGLVSCQVA